MPLDSRDKRASAILLGLRGAPAPQADGQLNQADRQQAAAAYRGILARSLEAADERASMLGLGLPFGFPFPQPDGDVGLKDKQQLAKSYRGIAAEPFSARASMLGLGLPLGFPLPRANGGLDQADRQHLANSYSGIAAASSANQAPTDIVLTPSSVPENSANGTVVGTATATDPDDPGETFTWSLLDNAGGRFAINASTGVVTVANGSLLDFETATSHNITIRVADQGGLSYQEVVTITVTDVIEAASGSRADIQAAVNSASDGDIIIIPDGVHDFGTGTVTITKRLWIRSAGLNRDNCMLDRAQGDVNDGDAFFLIQANGFRISHIHFQGRGFDDVKANGKGIIDRGVAVDGAFTDWRVDHCEFDRFGSSAVSSRYRSATGGTQPTGCVDNNFFHDLLQIDPDANSGANLGYAVSVHGDSLNAFNSPPNFGGADWVFVEDNVMTNVRHSITNNNGAKSVFRYNTVNGSSDTPDSQYDAHGREAWPAGTYVIEVYENTFNEAPTPSINNHMKIRGGGGVIFNNTMTGANQAIIVTNEESFVQDDDIGQPLVEDLYIWGNTFNGSALTASDVVSLRAALNEGDEYHVSSTATPPAAFTTNFPGYTTYTYPHPLRSAGWPLP